MLKIEEFVWFTVKCYVAVEIDYSGCMQWFQGRKTQFDIDLFQRFTRLQLIRYLLRVPAIEFLCNQSLCTSIHR